VNSIPKSKVEKLCEEIGLLFYNNKSSFNAYPVLGSKVGMFFRIFPEIKDNDIATVYLNKSFPFIIVLGRLLNGAQILSDFYTEESNFIRKSWGIVQKLSIKYNKIPILLLQEESVSSLPDIPTLMVIDPTVLPDNLYNYLSIPETYLSTVIENYNGRKSIISIFKLEDFKKINKETIDVKLKHMFNKEYERTFWRYNGKM